MEILCACFVTSCNLIVHMPMRSYGVLNLGSGIWMRVSMVSPQSRRPVRIQKGHRQEILPMAFLSKLY